MKKNTSRPVDKLWIVFDRDSFDPGEFNNAINRCEALSVVGCAWSNEAFELWYLLHFHYYQNAIGRQQYQQLIERNLQPHLGQEYRYEKNSTEMYALLKEYGSIEDAIRHAKQLATTYQGRRDYANHNPCTTVWELVEELLKLT